MRRMTTTVVLAILLFAAPARLVAEESYGSQAGWGMAAIGVNLLYMPAKLVYATLGLIAGGMTYAMTLGNSRAVDAIWSPTFGGTYVITPAMLRGDEPVLFFGETVQDD